MTTEQGHAAGARQHQVEQDQIDVLVRFQQLQPGIGIGGAKRHHVLLEALESLEQAFPNQGMIFDHEQFQHRQILSDSRQVVKWP